MTSVDLGLSLFEAVITTLNPMSVIKSLPNQPPGPKRWQAWPRYVLVVPVDDDGDDNNEAWGGGGGRVLCSSSRSRGRNSGPTGQSSV